MAGLLGGWGASSLGGSEVEVRETVLRDSSLMNAVSEERGTLNWLVGVMRGGL
jgi:hypothetical protein